MHKPQIIIQQFHQTQFGQNFIRISFSSLFSLRLGLKFFFCLLKPMHLNFLKNTANSLVFNFIAFISLQKSIHFYIILSEKQNITSTSQSALHLCGIPLLQNICSQLLVCFCLPSLLCFIPMRLPNQDTKQVIGQVISLCQFLLQEYGLLHLPRFEIVLQVT